MVTEGILAGYKTRFQQNDNIQNLEDLNLSHKDLRGIKMRKSQAPINKNDSICREFQKYTCGIVFITILFLRWRKTACKMFQT